MKMNGKSLLIAGLIIGAGFALDARAQCRETVSVFVGSESTLVVASDSEFTAVESAPVSVTVYEIKPVYVKKVVWVEPCYVMEEWGCGRWVKAYKPGHYKEVWVKADEA